MIIDLKAIHHGRKRFSFSLDKEWWKSRGQHEQSIAFDRPLIVRIEVYKAGEKFVLEGFSSGGLWLECDRCLKKYNRDLKHSFRLFFECTASDEDKIEVELGEDDMEVGFVDGESLDLDEIIQEQIYLSLPLKSLCQDDCKGLCPICGSDLNEMGCKCDKKQGHPGFLKLKKLNIEGD